MAQPRSRFPAYPPDLPEGLQLYLEAIRKEISTLGVSGGASIRIEESDAVVSTGANVIDFFGADFDVTQSPVGEANITISSGIARTGHTHDAADVTTGIFSRARLPSAIAYEDEANTFTLTQTFSVQLVSSVTTGTAPFSVASTTVVTNLNADFLDGQTGTFYTDLANATGNLAYARLPTGGGTWANGGTLSITGGVTTVAGLTSTANVSITAGKLLVDGTDQTLASGEIGLAENVGELWIGARSVIRLLMDDDATAAGSVVIAKGTQASSTTLLTVDINGSVVFATAAGKIIPGATSLSLRNTGDSADNILITDAGAITFRSSLAGATTLSLAGPITLTTAASKIIPGATSLALRNTADSADNAIWINAGDATFRTKLTMPGPLVLTTATSTIVPGATSLALRNTADSANNLLLTDAGLATLRNDLIIGTLGQFDSTDTPLDGQILFYHAGGTNRWQAESLQLIYNAGDAAVGLLADNTSVVYVYLDPGTGADSPAGAPPVPVIRLFRSHKAITVGVYASTGPDVDYHDGPSFPADFRHFIYEYSTDNFTTPVALATATSDKMVHGRLTSGTTYYYRVRAVDKAGNASANSATVSVAATASSDTAAFGIILASEISVDRLSALSANIGIITSGQIRNAGNTSGINFGGAGGIPGTWTSGINFEAAAGAGSMTRYINFTATGANPVIKHELLSLNADGTAAFGGLIDITGAPFAAAIGGAYVVTRDSDVAHGMTNLVPTDVNGLLWILSGTEGGLGVAGFSDTSNAALGLGAYNVGASTTNPVMIFEAGKKSGAGAGGLASTDLGFAFISSSVSPHLLDIFGNGDLVTSGILTFSTAASKVIPGATSFSLRNNANSADNLLVVDAGDVTIAGSLTVVGGLKLRSSNVTSVGTGAATVETDLMTYTLPTLANGDKVDVFAQGIVTGAANIKTIRARVGGTALATLITAAADTGDYFFHLQLVKDGATLRYIVAQTTNLATGATVILTGNVGVDLSGAIVKTTGATPTNTDEVTTEAMTIMIYKA